MANDIERLFRQLEPAESPAADAAALRALAADKEALALIAGKAFAEAAGKAALALADRVEALAPLLEPGSHPVGPDGRVRVPCELKPCGQADAVFYLDGVKNIRGEQVVSSPYDEALRYLRPVPDMVKSLLGHNLKWLGMSEPKGLESEIGWMRTLDKAAQASGRRLRHAFTFSERGVNAIQPQHAPRWRCYKIREDLWAVLYVDLEPGT